MVTNYEKYFGAPEKAAETSKKLRLHYMPNSNFVFPDFPAYLDLCRLTEWLQEEAE